MFLEDFRLDYILSGWIFAWFIVYLFGFTDFSPFLVFILAIIHNVIFYITTIQKESESIRNFFIIGNIFIKIIPVAYLIYKKQTKITFNDVIATISVIVVYNVWMAISKPDKIKIQIHKK